MGGWLQALRSLEHLRAQAGFADEANIMNIQVLMITIISLEQGASRSPESLFGAGLVVEVVK